MPKTLTPIGVQKIGQRFADSVDHAAYTLNGQPKTVAPFRKIVEGEAAKVYIYFDDTVTGEVANVQLVDTDGDVISETDRAFTKPPSKGLYISGEKLPAGGLLVAHRRTAAYRWTGQHHALWAQRSPGCAVRSPLPAAGGGTPKLLCHPGHDPCCPGSFPPAQTWRHRPDRHQQDGLHGHRVCKLRCPDL